MVEEKKEHVSDDLKVFVSRIPVSFDESHVKRLLEEVLGENSVVDVTLGEDADEKDGADGVKDEEEPSSDRFARPSSKKKAADEEKIEREHKGFAFVVLQDALLVQKAIDVRTIRGGRKATSKKKHTLYIAPCLTDEQKECSLSDKPCFLWEKFRCPYGENCKFSHEGPGGLLEKKPKSQKKCRDYRKGKCKLSSEECPFSHDFEVKEKKKNFEVKKDSEKDCINWKTKGKCRKLETCPYRHDPALRAAAIERKKRKLEKQNPMKRKKKQPLTVQVFGLNYASSESDVRKLFQDCGPIVAINFPTFEDSGRGKGYCWLTFQSPKAVSKAIEKNNVELHGRWLSVKSGKKMYVNGDEIDVTT